MNMQSTTQFGVTKFNVHFSHDHELFKDNKVQHINVENTFIGRKRQKVGETEVKLTEINKKSGKETNQTNQLYEEICQN